MRAWRWCHPRHGSTPAGTNYGSPERLKTAGVLAGVADWGRSKKWCYRGDSGLGFKTTGGLPRWREIECRTRDKGQCRAMREDNVKSCREGKGERTLAGGT